MYVSCFNLGCSFIRSIILEIKLVLKGFCKPDCHLLVAFGIAGTAFTSKEEIGRFKSFQIPVGPGTADNMASAA